MSKGQIIFARIHLLPAKEAPYVVVLRRKPSHLFHVMRWNTQTDEIEHGNWFSGRIYEFYSDVSFDGAWIVYLAKGRFGFKWVGLCHPLRRTHGVGWSLSLIFDNHAGGYFFNADTLILSSNLETGKVQEGFDHGLGEFGFNAKHDQQCYPNVDIGYLGHRFERDGYRKTEPIQMPDVSFFGRCKQPGKISWVHQPSKDHPSLRATYIGEYVSSGRVVFFDLPEFPDLLGFGVTWATYDCLGQLIVARLGALERYTLDDIRLGKPSFRLDLEGLVPPDRE